MLGSVIKFVVLATLLTALIILSSPPVITKNFALGLSLCPCIRLALPDAVWAYL